ncbi:hypothetical protein [Propionispora vibrioides]|uniref:Uncharacterized protein n=1 Tax=Propionispora vibrioides TaxID=112903 RepID=A0A1H8X055_9FIRM|nr:hypothetical protein [Propionispora vibrioides]SEP33246.1 hypothetical protein SAMN04490178_11933 [Propionispora vibrioides]
MFKNINGWMIGALVVVTTLGLAFGATSLGKASAQGVGTVQKEQLDNKKSDMMANSPDMQKQCKAKMKDVDLDHTGAAAQSGEAKKSPDMMKSPAMQQHRQSMMKESGDTNKEKTTANDIAAGGDRT